MEGNIFISHSSKDREIVSIFAELLNRLMGSKVNIWFSSDTREEGGFMVGNNWYETILEKLKKSDVVISFITENSNNMPWLLYESGYAEALEKTLLVPLKFMVDIHSISVPLQHKQIFSFSNMDEITEFLRKILQIFGYVYDEEAYSEIVLNYLSNMRSKYNSPNNVQNESDEVNYIIELGKKIDNLLNYTYSSMEQKAFSYEIPVEYEINGKKMVEFICIDSSLTVSDILDHIYFLLYKKVLPYTYMTSWILKEKRTDRYAIVSSIQDWIPANYVFRSETAWEVVYISDDSFLDDILKEERLKVNS